MRYALMTVLILFCFGCAKPRPPGPPATPLALDPLTESERSGAEKTARADGRVRELIGDAGILAHIAWFAPKPAEASAEVVRHAELLFAIPSGEYGVRALVRLGAPMTVVETARIDARNVPMTDGEIQEVWRIAQADPAVRSKLGNRMPEIRPEALRSYSEDPNDPCYRGRCYYLLLRVGNNYLNEPAITVELNSKRVLAERSKLQ